MSPCCVVLLLTFSLCPLPVAVWPHGRGSRISRILITQAIAVCVVCHISGALWMAVHVEWCTLVVSQISMVSSGLSCSAVGGREVVVSCSPADMPTNLCTPFLYSGIFVSVKFWLVLLSFLLSPSPSCPFLILLLFHLHLRLIHSYFSHRPLRPASLSPQVDSMDNFTPSNTPSRDDDPKSHLKSRSRSPSMASDMEPIEVSPSRISWTVVLLFWPKMPDFCGFFFFFLLNSMFVGDLVQWQLLKLMKRLRTVYLSWLETWWWHLHVVLTTRQNNDSSSQFVDSLQWMFS